MVTFRNNNGRRNNFRRNDRNYKISNGDRSKFGASFTSSENFQRKAPGRNNHNASKLIEKYNNLAREALSIGDKIMSENYFQHADHFSRVLNDQELHRKNKNSYNHPNKNTQDADETQKENVLKNDEKKDVSLKKVSENI